MTLIPSHCSVIVSDRSHPEPSQCPHSAYQTYHLKMAGADSNSDDIEIIEAPWEQAVLQDRDYKDAYNIFSGRK
jgi:hypothetical protein